MNLSVSSKFLTVRNKILYIFFFFVAFQLTAQDSDTLKVNQEKIVVAKDSIRNPRNYDPLAPARAAFYSAVLPGLGQAYNQRYWKIPVIYGGMGAGVYFYLRNDKDYNRFRDAYKRRLAGFTDDEFFGDKETPLVSQERLIDAQKSAQRNKDISVVVTVLFYLLNVVDANVDAHLQQFNVSDDLSLKPTVNTDFLNPQANYGMSLTYRLK